MKSSAPGYMLDVHDHVLTAVHLSRITKSLDGQVNFT
jgi:hypothetical protein